MLDILGDAALRSVLLAGVVQSVLWLLRIRQAQLLLATWTIVLAASIVMPLLLQCTPLRFPLESTLPRTLIDGAADLLQPSPQVPPVDTSVTVEIQPSLGSWLEVIYLVVGCGIVLRVVLGAGLSFRMLARAVPVRPDWAAGARIRISRDVTGPVTIAHVIVLPSDAVDWAVATRQAVLAHERAHVARWDFAMLIVSQLNRALFWFSPLSWWLHRRLVALTELASDDQAIASTRDRLGYAEILLEMGRRAGRLPRGPAMARLSTLPHRIDRILLDQALPQRVGRPQQVLLTLGVAGLSLAVASVAPGSVAEPAMTLLAQQEDPKNDDAIGATRYGEDVDATGQTIAASQTPVQGGASAPILPPFATDAAIEPPARPSSTSPHSVPLPATAGQPARPAPPPPRTVLRTSMRPAPVPPSRAMERPIPIAMGQARREGKPGAQIPSLPEIPSHMAEGAGITSKTSGPADDEGRSSPAHQTVGSLSPPHPEAEAVVGSTCTGNLAVGLGAWQTNPYKQPDVVAGQRIPVQAQFFRRNNSPWVRFDVFGRPPLDLPVRFARSGMTWTGEYGISYTVQDAGGHHLVGLAARIANDSATLEFACVRSATPLL